MPIDTLKIGYHTSRRVNDGVAPEHNSIDFYDVITSIPDGYTVSPISRGNPNGQGQLHRSVHFGNYRDVVRFSGRESGDYAYLNEVTFNLSKFSSWQNFMQFVQHITQDDPQRFARFMAGQIKRIDYTCDYAENLMEIMKGLYCNPRSTSFSCYLDAHDSPYLNYFWERGTFNSFTIGRKPKLLRIYDKRLEEITKQERLQLRTLEREYDENNTTFQVSRRDYVESQIQEARDNILRELRNAPPKTRIEVSLQNRAAINRMWGREQTQNAPILSDLWEHLRQIRMSHRFPFSQVLLNYINTRNSRRHGVQFGRSTARTYELRALLDAGLLIPTVRRWGDSFWREHRDFFVIRSWPVAYQPSQVYKSVLSNWCRPSSSGYLYAEGYPLRQSISISNTTPVIDRWPMEITRS